MYLSLHDDIQLNCILFSDGRVTYPPQSFQIILGSIKRTASDEKRIYRNVKKISIPDEYERAMYFWGSDIAIMAMEDPVEFNEYIRPVCLPRPDEVFPISSLCYVSGWGYTNYYGKLTSVGKIIRTGVQYDVIMCNVMRIF